MTKWEFDGPLLFQMDLPPHDGIYWCRIMVDDDWVSYMRLRWTGDELGQGGKWSKRDKLPLQDNIRVCGWWPLPEG